MSINTFRHKNLSKRKQTQTKTTSQNRETVEVWRIENLINYILNDLEKRIKKDKAVKLSVFFNGLSAYLPEPINLFLKGESGIGKTYNVVETLRYFPKEDVWFLGGLSPKALIHDYGELLNKDGEPLDLTDRPVKPKKKHYNNEEEYREASERYKEELKAWSEEIRNSYTLIDLSHKTLVFLESPEYNTFRMLYPILSHDTERIEYRFTNKTAKGQLRTSKVVIQGWPATVFLTTDKRYIEELATRSFTVTPEASKEKIEQANILTGLKTSFPWKYNHETRETETIKQLVLSLRNRFINESIDVVIPFMNLHELFPKEIIRDMRDFQHFTQFLKTITALNFYQRAFMKVKDKRFLLSTVEDVRKSLEVYLEVFETTRTGTEQRILTFYHETVKTKEIWYLKELTAEYNKKHTKKLSSGRISELLKRLSEIGYVDIQKDNEDKRLNIYKRLIMEEEKSRISSILETKIVLQSKLEEGFNSWRTNCFENIQFYYYKNFSENKWGEHEINIEEAMKIILQGFHNEIFSSTQNRGFSKQFSKEDSQVKTEKKAEDISISKTEIFRDNPEKPKESWIKKREGNKITALDNQTLFACPLCAAKGKQMFFDSQPDLDIHIRKFHEKPSYVR